MPDRQSIGIMGGGVIGLSMAWELIRRHHRVTVFDTGPMGRKASWAGAGILSPANHRTMTHPLDQLLGLGSELHEAWAGRLQEETGIDNGFRKCGGVYLARTPGERAALQGQMWHWREYGVEHEQIDSLAELRADGVATPDQVLAVRVPGESQICNPDHLQALMAACRKNGAVLNEHGGDVHLNSNADGVVSIATDSGNLAFDQVVVCTGVWSTRLLQPLDVDLPMIPVRGQIHLYKLPRLLFPYIINEGSRYIVPRDDGHVIVGSTTEEVGFDESTTEEKLADLHDFANSIVPALEKSRLERSWAGLRPASHDGFPFLGRVAGFRNLLVATGHFKAGLQMSTATAVLMSDTIEGRATQFDLGPFACDRINRAQGIT
jgi:glycine oxidase